MNRASKRKAPPPFSIGSIVIALLLVPAFAGAGAGDIPLDSKGLPMWEIREFDDFPVQIELPSTEALDRLLIDVPIASFNREQITINSISEKEYRIVFEPRVTDEEAALLTSAGYSWEAIPDLEQEVRRAMESAWAAQAAKGGDDLKFGEKGVYHTHAQIGAILYQAKLDHPTIVDTFIIGNTVQGRPIWGIRISDNVAVEEAEPEIRLTSTMHGNEPPGLEMLLYLIDFLTDEYATDPDAAELVNNYELHIIPLHNPDGHVVSDRENANGIDLNRNFPVPDGSIGDDGTYTEEPETYLYKNYCYNQNFVIGMDGHSGALVVNYPWDYIYDLTPDDSAIEQMALEYSTYNVPMYNGSFTQGITRGCNWYVTEGSIQDWSYQETGCVHVIIEYSDSFQPAASTLDNLWLNDNKQSFIHWIKTATYGVNGIVTGSDTGLPLDATVTVTGNSKSVYTDPDFGDYYKLLNTGTYDITYSASGYIPETHYSVSVTWGTPTVLDVDLDPVAYGDVSGNVREVGAGTGLDADIEIRTYPGDVYVTTVQCDAASAGAYTVSLVYGSYNFHVSSLGHTSADRVVVVGSPSVTEDFLLGVVTSAVLFEDDFEGGTSQWSGDWATTTSASTSPTHSFTDSPGGDYASRDTTIGAMAYSVNLMDAENCSLSFQAMWETETNWDCAVLEISTNGGSSWTPIATSYTVAASGQGAQKPAGIPVFEGTQLSWVRNAISLAAWQGESDVRFRFRMKSDSSTQRDGFYVDDFIIWGEQVATGVAQSVPVTTTRLAGNVPNPFNPTTQIRFELGAPAAVSLSIYDLSGRQVRQLIASQSRVAGRHELAWDGRTDSGADAASGLYFYRLEAGALSDVRKMLLIR